MSADKNKLHEISAKNMLSLTTGELCEIQKYFKKKGRNPTDVELETIAQTWSEHCKHKTLTAEIKHKAPHLLSVSKGDNLKIKQDNRSNEQKVRGKIKNYNNLLKDTIFKATKKINKKWCLSVFKDNAGVIEFDKKYAVAFKVETHNHPSAIEPYGGAETGVGGVVRDILGVGLGAKPIMNTDVFCFGDLDISYKKLHENVLHPKRIYKRVVEGVRDYGNRMGIPTANGAIIFDEGYLFNPLVFCGTVGIIPKNKVNKKIHAGDLIVSIGGRTGRDGIHGATFSSASLDKDVPAGVVQIGNPIEEKRFADVLVKARDKELYNAITDCGAGGYSSAIGELALFSGGAEVHLDKVPLKYDGLLPWEIWLSESQERMVIAVKKNKIAELKSLFESEDVQVSVLGNFTDSGDLKVYYKNTLVCEMDLDFLHDGLPKSKRTAVWSEKKPMPSKEKKETDLNKKLIKLLSSPNIASKESVIRQYDFEVQGQTVIKPLVGVANDGPSDAVVLKPLPDSYRGIVVSNGINLYGKHNTYDMAASAIDEALRNIIAVGGVLDRTALLDNFCWGELTGEKQFGELVRACEACYALSVKFGTPFISGKDSLNNKYQKKNGEIVSIPPTLLISALSIIEDIRKCVTMDFKKPNNPIYLLGITKDEYPPKVDPVLSKKVMLFLQTAIQKGFVAASHDCSDGGLGVALSEMCFSGGFGAVIDLKNVAAKNILTEDSLIFSESNGRFVVEVKKEFENDFVTLAKNVCANKIGSVSGSSRGSERLIIKGLSGAHIIDCSLYELKYAWQKTLS